MVRIGFGICPDLKGLFENAGAEPEAEKGKVGGGGFCSLAAISRFGLLDLRLRLSLGSLIKERNNADGVAAKCS